jgi:hypothetical protein
VARRILGVARRIPGVARRIPGVARRIRWRGQEDSSEDDLSAEGATAARV